MKYKVGDKILLPMEIVVKEERTIEARAEDGSNLYFSQNTIDKTAMPFTTKTYTQGLADAWELAKKIRVQQSDGGIPLNEIENIFGAVYIDTIFKNNTYAEALAKIEAYEKEKEIKVGDEVVHGCDGFETKFYVTYLTKNQIKGFGKDGNTHYFTLPNRYIKKTGKHIDIESLLKEIGE